MSESKNVINIKFPPDSKNIFDKNTLTDSECLKWLENTSLNPRNGKNISQDIELYRYMAKECLNRKICFHPYLQKMQENAMDEESVSNIDETPKYKNNMMIIKLFELLIEFKITQLRELPRATTPDQKKEKFGLERSKFAFNKAIGIIKNLEFDITDSKQIKDYPGIGKGIMARIDEILKTNKLVELEPYMEKIKSLELKEIAISQLKKVYGIGDINAQNLYEKKNITNINELREAHKKGLVDLTSAQILGLKYYEDLLNRIPREEIDIFNEQLKKIIKKIDPKIIFIIAGSYRRNTKDSGDIDILLSHDKINYLDELLENMSDLIIGELAHGDTKFNGIVRLNKDSKARRLDIRFVPKENYYPALLYFTGSGNFNVEMRKRAQTMGYKLNEYHLLKIIGMENIAPGKKPIKSSQLTEKKIIVNSEKEIFDILGMDYLEPHQREMGK